MQKSSGLRAFNWRSECDWFEQRVTTTDLLVCAKRWFEFEIATKQKPMVIFNYDIIMDGVVDFVACTRRGLAKITSANRSAASNKHMQFTVNYFNHVSTEFQNYIHYLKWHSSRWKPCHSAIAAAARMCGACKCGERVSGVRETVNRVCNFASVSNWMFVV